MTSTNDVKKLFKKGSKGLGLDDESSSIVIANIDATTTPMCLGSPFDADEQETDEFRLVEFVLDASRSMDPVEQEVRDGMNKIVMPALLEGAASQVGAIRYHGIKFDSVISTLWGTGWERLINTTPKLSRENYSAGTTTALNKAVLDGVTALTTQATQVEDETGTYPECVLTVISDGANNCAPRSSSSVKKVLEQLSPELFTLIFIGFETNEPVDFKKIAADLGFRDIIDLKKKAGETDAEMRRRLRHLFHVYSEKLVGRVSSSQVGTGKSQSGSSGFWND